MARFPVYRYALRRPGAAPETRWSFQPVKPGGYAGNDEPHEAHAMGMEDAEPTQMHPAGEVEAPELRDQQGREPAPLVPPGGIERPLRILLGFTPSRGCPHIPRSR